jgi:hypothetical protein
MISPSALGPSAMLIDSKSSSGNAVTAISITTPTATMSPDEHDVLMMR